MAQRRSSQLTIGYSSVWKRQSAWDVPLANADVDRAFPATSRNYLDIDETVEDVFDCTGEDFLFEIVTGKFARLNIDFDVDPDILAGITAFAYGVAAAPSGGTDEVQTETITASGGTRRLTVQIGANAQTTAPIAFDADSAAVQAALEALSNVAPNDIVVTGDGPHVYTFSGSAFEKQDVHLIQVNTFALTGGTSTIVETTPGIGLTHAISRIVGYTLPLMTLYIGFRGSDKQPKIFKNVVVDQFRVRSASREKVTCSVQLVGSADLDYATGYTMPDCTDILPIRFGDCALTIGGTDFIASNLAREFEYYYQNDVVPKFDGAGIYTTRHERADRRPSGFNLFLLGEPGDSLYEAADARTTLSTALRVGTAGRNVTYTAPQGITKLAPTPIRFAGDPSESEMAIVVRPKKVAGDTTTPTSCSAIVGIPATLLTAA